MFKVIWNYFGKYKKHVKLCFFATLLETITFLIIPALLAKLFDVGLANNDKSYVYEMGTAMIICAVLSMAIGIYENHLSAIAGQGLGYNLRNKLFQKVMHLSSANVDDFTSSSLITRLNSDINAIQTGAIQFMRMVFVGGWRIVIAMVLAITISAKLNWILVGCVVVFLVFLVVIMALGIPWFTRMQQEMDLLNTSTQDNTRAQRVVKAFVRYRYEEEKFNKPNSNLRYISWKANGIMMSIIPLSALVMNVAIAGVLWFGGKKTGTGSIQIGELNTFLSYAMQVCAAIGMVSVCTAQIGKSMAAAGRVFAVINAKNSVADTSKQSLETLNSGKIQFIDTTFKYNESSTRVVLNKINVTIPSGQFFGIIGSTGEGKTSLLNLIPRFYDSTSGKVIIGEHDVSDYSLDTLRNEIGLVPQTSTLFTGTIEGNLRWGNENASRQDLVEACKAAQIHDFIMSLENGYNSIVERGGSNFSGGQRQRLCIARALLKKPKILLLDDSTSALDRITEEKVQSMLRNTLKGTTIVLIAQKILSVKNADSIIVMNEGKVSGIGTHDQLLKSNKVYKEIFNSQTKGVA